MTWLTYKEKHPNRKWWQFWKPQYVWVSTPYFPPNPKPLDKHINGKPSMPPDYFRIPDRLFPWDKGISKRLDPPWAPASKAGGLDTGSRESRITVVRPKSPEWGPTITITCLGYFINGVKVPIDYKETP